MTKYFVVIAEYVSPYRKGTKKRVAPKGTTLKSEIT